jgi:hypothetical protein
MAGLLSYFALGAAHVFHAQGEKAKLICFLVVIILEGA